MKRFIVFIAFALVMAVSVNGQNDKHRKFSPEKFRADMEQFIVKEACLTPTESASFFPVYNEMYKKQRIVFDNMRRLNKSCPATDAEYRKVIKERDKLDVELKKIQQTYHNKFLDILSPQKVFKVLNAEDRFHHRMLRRGEEGKKI